MTSDILGEDWSRCDLHSTDPRVVQLALLSMTEDPNELLRHVTTALRRVALSLGVRPRLRGGGSFDACAHECNRLLCLISRSLASSVGQALEDLAVVHSIVSVALGAESAHPIPFRRAA